MFPVLCVQFSAAADGRQVNIDADCTIIGFHGAGAATGAAVLSRDPKTTIANSVTAPIDQLTDNVLACSRASDMISPLKIPISAGQSVFVSASAVMSVFIFIEVTPI